MGPRRLITARSQSRPPRTFGQSTYAIVGPNAALPLFGNYSGNPATPPVTPVAGIRTRAGSEIAVRLVPWSATLSPIPSDYLTTANGQLGLSGEYFDNETLAGEPNAKRVDREIQFISWGWTLPVDTISEPRYSARWTGRLIPPVTGNYQLGINVVGEARLFLNGENVVEGTTGILTKTVPLQAGHSYALRLEYFHHKVSDDGIRLVWKPPGTDIQQLRRYDVVIAILGLNTDLEDETTDKTTLALPTDQQEFIREVVQVNSHTIVLLESGSPVAINWIQKNVPAILEAWYPGEQGGNAIADVLFGDYDPAGRLPITFYASDAQLPPMDDYDITKGRTYMYVDQPPLYPFGYGLSYTNFQYTNLKLWPKVAGSRGVIHASVDITNVGHRGGDEVVQVYLHKEKRTDKQPGLQLKAFQRVHLHAGERRTLKLVLPTSDWARWDVVKKSFGVDPGTFDVSVGASSADIRLTDQVTVRDQASH